MQCRISWAYTTVKQAILSCALWHITQPGGVAPLSPPGPGADAGHIAQFARQQQQQQQQQQAGSTATLASDAFVKEELTLQELTDLACMFSFGEGGQLSFVAYIYETSVCRSITVCSRMFLR